MPTVYFTPRTVYFQPGPYIADHITVYHVYWRKILFLRNWTFSSFSVLYITCFLSPRVDLNVKSFELQTKQVNEQIRNRFDKHLL